MKYSLAFIFIVMLASAYSYDADERNIFASTSSLNGSDTENSMIAASDDIVSFYIKNEDTIVYYPKDEYLQANYTGMVTEE